MLALRSALFNIVFIGWSIVIMMTAWLLMPAPRSILRRYIALWPRVIFPALRFLTGIKIEIRGRERLPGGPVIYAVKHQSAFETLFFLWFDPTNAYVMKAELAWIPFWGWYMRRCRHISIKRKDGARAMRDMIRTANNILAERRSIAIFPEGTRMPPGQTGTYHPGIAALYAQCKVPIVPVALNSGTFWPRRSFIKKPGTIVLEFLDPMPDGLSRKEFMAELERRIETATKQLESEAGLA